MTNFKKDEQILRVQNIGGRFNANWHIVKEEVYSCGKKQLILKNKEGFKGEKISISWYNSNGFDIPFFKIEDINQAKKSLKKEIKISKESELKRYNRLGW